MVIVAAIVLAAVQEPGIYETKYRFEKAIRRIQGVQDVGIAGVNGELRIVVRVDGKEAEEAVRLLVGDRLQGHPVSILGGTGSGGSGTAVAPSTCSCRERRSGSTVAEPNRGTETDRREKPVPDYERCDVMREYLDLPKLSKGKDDPVCQVVCGLTNDPARIQWIVREGFKHFKSQKDFPSLRASDKLGVDCPEHGKHSGETIVYTWVKHVRSCPYGRRQIIEELEKLTPGK
jgi:hypothetical protein